MRTHHIQNGNAYDVFVDHKNGTRKFSMTRGLAKRYIKKLLPKDMIDMLDLGSNNHFFVYRFTPWAKEKCIKSFNNCK